MTSPAEVQIHEGVFGPLGDAQEYDDVTETYPATHVTVQVAARATVLVKSVAAPHPVVAVLLGKYEK